uniref:Uncharacterized protein n=1 Tax=Anopheles albimanus TaxID=7167 RepID=A0A182FQ01_ANOAL
MPKENRIRARKVKVQAKNKDANQPDTNGEKDYPKSSSTTVDQLRKHVTRYHCSEAQVASLLKLLSPYIPDLQKEDPKEFRKCIKMVKPKKGDE